MEMYLETCGYDRWYPVARDYFENDLGTFTQGFFVHGKSPVDLKKTKPKPKPYGEQSSVSSPLF